MSVQHINDYSQTRLWLECPAKWYERYVQRRVRKPSTRQRDDAMCLGSLVHSGLENWYLKGQATITDDTIEENTPTRETLNLAESLVYAYVQNYCREPWELVATEEPVVMPLTPQTSLLAKVDTYFHVDREMELDTFDPGYTIRLTPGYWGLEHKTKDSGINRANWMQGWESNLQASFQTMALEYKLGCEIQGIIVNVIEKTKPYVPTRKCKGCAQQYELAAYIGCGDGQAMCPVCGYAQTVKPYVPTKLPVPSFFRMKVQRSREQLDVHLNTIRRITQAMEIARENPDTIIPNLEACVHKFYGPCEYWRNHTLGISTLDDPEMTTKDTSKYMGLVVL